LTPKATKYRTAMTTAVLGSMPRARSATAIISRVPVARYRAAVAIRNRNEPSRLTTAKISAELTMRASPPSDDRA
jgi:hypothetical protein